MKAIWQGVVLAESNKTINIEGNHYFPPESMHREYFIANDEHTICPWKGVASYFDIKIGNNLNSSAAWYYPDPKYLALAIKGYIAFWHGIEVVE